MRKWKWWLVLGLGIVAVCIAAINWLRTYEPIAIWLEGVALVAIFVLDWKERKDQRTDREQQHRETLTQLQITQKQADALINSERLGHG